MVDDNWGDYRHKLEIQNLDLMRPHVIGLLRTLLVGYPDWEIPVRVDVIGKESDWPGMGIIIHDDGIVDDLQREYLPEEFRHLRYEGTK